MAHLNRRRAKVVVHEADQFVDESHAPSHRTLADRAGNRVCICAWPDGATQKASEILP
jgi:4a-hydroxytetrahydrobiopterin dehydratase